MPALTTATVTAGRRARMRRAPVVRLAVHSDFDGVVKVAKSTRNASGTSLEDRLARHFAVPWQANANPGYVLVDDQEIVGFLASLTHTRPIRGQLETICNLGSWYVRASHRRHSLTLVREALRRFDITYTAVSPIARVAKIITRFGFQKLETHRRTIYPMMSFLAAKGRPSMTTGDVSSLLSSDLLKIYHDHESLDCEHAVLEYEGRRCYIVFVRQPRRFVSAANIHYLSDSDCFGECVRHHSGHLCRRLGVTSLVVHDRYLDDRPIRLSRRRPLDVPHMFRSNSLSPADIDDLYSERVVMGF